MKKSTIKRLISYLKNHKLLLLGSFVGSLFYVPLGLLAPIFIGRAIDGIVGKGDVNFTIVWTNLIFLLITMAFSAFFQWLTQVFTRNISAYVAQQMRQQAFQQLERVPLSRIDSQSHGDIVSRLINDTDAVSEGLLQALTQLFPSLVTIVTTVILMLTLNVGISIAVIVITPVSILFAKFVSGRVGGKFREQTTAQGAISGYVNEMVTNQNVLYAFDYAEASEAEFEKLNQTHFTANFKATLYASIINPGTRFINSLVYAAVGVFGGLLAISGGITIGGISAFLAYANQYTKPFNDISAVFAQLQAAIASSERLFEVIDWPAEPKDPDNALAPLHAVGTVQAQDVYFSYTPQRPLIQEFCMDVKPGQRIALVGPTGCGKTTLINLLMRFYDIDSGTITVDGNSIRNIQRSSLRGLYGMVLQETWLKQATVKENIAYARPDATMDEIISAAKAAYAHSFIKRLPQGYDTIIQTGGGNLSAGQKQLLCIARIMLAKPDMLILDEATSSIDTRTEMLIQKALEKLMKGHTSFIVAHRLSTIQNADCILVMNAGRVIERGTHEELLAQNGFYANLYNSQFKVQ